MGGGQVMWQWRCAEAVRTATEALWSITFMGYSAVWGEHPSVYVYTVLLHMNIVCRPYCSTAPHLTGAHAVSAVLPCNTLKL